MPALKLRAIDGWLDDSDHPKLERPALVGINAKTLWGYADTNGLVSVELYGIAPGGAFAPHAHPGNVTIIICWRGKGKAVVAEAGGSGWQPAYAEFSFKKYDTFVVPRGALYRVRVEAGETEQLVMLVIHPIAADGFEEVLADLPESDDRRFPEPKRLDPDDSWDPTRNEQIYVFDPIGAHRAKRVRIWGREGESGTGAADWAKQDCHLVAYCFGKGQENPPHFHPYSVEFMLGMLGDTLTYTRDKRWGRYEAGWKPEREQGTIRNGDTALVPLADIHRYVNHAESASIVLALQTPQPIMHTLEMETNF
jgi:quercetin dioxygenase-like cupin family protein